MKPQGGSGRRKPHAGRGKGKPGGKDVKNNKPKSLKNQIRDMERLLAKVREVACSLEGTSRLEHTLNSASMKC